MDFAGALCLYVVATLAIALVVKAPRLWFGIAWLHLTYSLAATALLGVGFAKDSLNYFEWATTGQRIGLSGSELVVTIVFVLNEQFGLGYQTISAAFSIVAALGYYLVLARLVMLENRTWTKALFWVILLEPSAHVFSATISKESLTLLLTGLFVDSWCRRRWALALAACVGLGAVRPHFGAAMAGAIAVAFLANRVWSYRAGVALVLGLNLTLIAAVTADVAISIPYLKAYNIDTDAGVASAIGARSSVYLTTSSGYDPRAYSTPMRAVVFFLGAGDGLKLSPGRIVTIIGGVAAMCAMLVAAVAAARRRSITALSLCFSALILTYLLASVNGNAGLAARQRMMPLLVCMAAMAISQPASPRRRRLENGPSLGGFLIEDTAKRLQPLVEERVAGSTIA